MKDNCPKCNGYGKVKYKDLFTVMMEEYWVDCPVCRPSQRRSK